MAGEDLMDERRELEPKAVVALKVKFTEDPKLLPRLMAYRTQGFVRGWVEDGMKGFEEGELTAEAVALIGCHAADAAIRVGEALGQPGAEWPAHMISSGEVAELLEEYQASLHMMEEQISG